MRAVANFPEDGEMRVADVDGPEISDEHHVLIRTLAVGLCGTDREIASQEHGEPPDGGNFLVIGHEALGEVVEVGGAVKDFRPGQLVVPRVRRPCSSQSCKPCQMGRPDFCVTGQFTERGILKNHGFLCEEFVECDQYLHVVPEEGRRYGVLVEPMTVAMKAFIQAGDVQERLPHFEASNREDWDFSEMTAVVLGAGPVGLLGALALMERGATVFVYSRSQEPTAASVLIESCGAQYVSSEVVDAEQLMEMTGPVHLMYEATGASQFAFEAASILGRNGIYVLTGVPGRKGPVSISIDKLMRDMVLKNQVLLGTVNAGPAAFEAAVESLQRIDKRWPGVLEWMITDVVDPADVGQVLKVKKASESIKQIVEFK